MQMAIRKNRLFIRLSGELDQSVTENLKIRVSEIIDKYMIKHLIINFERYSTYVKDFFDNYPEVQKYINELDLDPIYDLIIKEASRLGDDAFHTIQIRLTSCLSYILRMRENI